MPRDISGNYLLPAENPVTGGTVIESAWANNTMDDLGAEIQDSLSRSGKGYALAPIKILDGREGLPGLAFLNESGSGFKRYSTGDLRLASEGVDIFRTNPATKGPEGWDNEDKEWVSLLPEGTPGNPTNPATTAANVSYDNVASGLTAADVQAAIDEQVANPPDADGVDYDNTESGLNATATQEALDELKSLIDQIPAPYANPNGIISGAIQGSDGTTLKTEGSVDFISSRTATGQYTITFDINIGFPYAVVTTLNTTDYKPHISVYAESTTFFSVQIADSNEGDLQDHDWSFLMYFGAGECGQNPGAFDSTVLALTPTVYWPMQEGVGFTAVDSMGNANGTYEIITKFNQSSLVKSDNSVIGITVDEGFWNAGARVLSTSNVFNAQRLSFSTCVRRQSDAVTGTVCRRDSSNLADRQFYMQVSSGGNRIDIAYANFPERDWKIVVVSNLSAFGLNLNDGQPHILTGVIDSVSNRQEIWIDGTLVSNFSGIVETLNTPGASSYMTVGQGRFTGSPSIDGDISHWVFWNRALSSSEVGQLHASWNCQ